MGDRMTNSCLLCTLLIGLTSTAHAQPQRYLLEETTVKDGAGSGFESAQKEYCAAVVRGGAPSCNVMSPTTFSPLGLYLTLLAFGSFAHYDEGTYTSKGLTPEEARDLSSRRAPAIAQNQESAIELQGSLSFIGQGSGVFVEITEIQLHAGALPVFSKLLEDLVLPAAHKANFAGFEVYRTVAGGNPDRLFLIRRLRKFAELDVPDPLRNVMPESQQVEFDTGFSKCVAARSVHIMRLREDLSRARP